MSLSISFKGKRVLVTGAARGLGKDIVEVLHKQEAVVYALSRNPENLAKLESEFPGIKTVRADLSNWEDTRKAVEKCGAIDYLINNAGVAQPQMFMNVTPESFDDQWNTNVKAVINVSQVVAQGMIDRGNGGCIINVSSVGAKVAARMCGIYDTTKAALDMVTKTMAVELGKYNIRVNSVNPAMFETDMTKNFLQNNPGGGGPYQARTPIKRLVESREIVNTILFLMSDLAPMINAASVLLDGGYAAN